MATWKAYAWTDFDESDLPWLPGSEAPVMPSATPNFDRGSDGSDLDPLFDQSKTYFTTLSRPWGPYLPGTRVLISPSRVAIEERDFSSGAVNAARWQMSQ